MLWKDVVVNSKLLGIAPDGKAVRNWEWDLPLEFTKDDISATLSGKCLKIYLAKVSLSLRPIDLSFCCHWLLVLQAELKGSEGSFPPRTLKTFSMQPSGNNEKFNLEIRGNYSSQLSQTTFRCFFVFFVVVVVLFCFVFWVAQNWIVWQKLQMSLFSKQFPQSIR